jgi:hypothetical protein
LLIEVLLYKEADMSSQSPTQRLAIQLEVVAERMQETVQAFEPGSLVRRCRLDANVQTLLRFLSQAELLPEAHRALLTQIGALWDQGTDPYGRSPIERDQAEMERELREEETYVIV